MVLTDLSADGQRLADPGDQVGLSFILQLHGCILQLHQQLLAVPEHPSHLNPEALPQLKSLLLLLKCQLHCCLQPADDLMESCMKCANPRILQKTAVNLSLVVIA